MLDSFQRKARLHSFYAYTHIHKLRQIFDKIFCSDNAECPLLRELMNLLLHANLWEHKSILSSDIAEVPFFRKISSHVLSDINL